MSIRDDFFAAKAKGSLWDVAVSIKRGNPLPLDADSIFESYAALEAYAADVLAYPGQLVAVVEEASTGIYYLDQELAIKPVGVIPSGDNKSIEVTADGVISLLGASTAANGTLPMVGEDGKLTWKTLEDIGAGDGNDNTTYDITALENTEGEAYGIQIQVKENGVATGDPVEIALDVYTKKEIDNLFANLEDADTTYSVKEGEKVLKLEGTEFSTEISLKHENGMISLTGIGGEVIAEFSDADFIKDSVLEDVNYNILTNEIEFTWKTIDGKTKTDAVNVADFVQTYTAGNGLELSGNEFAVKVDSASEAFLTVGENGLKLAGVQNAINGVLTEVANNYYNKTEVYNKNEVYAKSEVYTKGEADKAIADKITEVNGGESAGEVLGQLTAYQKIVNMEVWGNETAEGDSRIDTLATDVLALQNVGAQANVIEAIKVNGTALEIDDKKTVEIDVPTALNQLEGYTTLNELIETVSKQANKGVDDAAKASAAAATNAAAIALLQQADEGLLAAKNDHAGRIQTLETAKEEHDAAYTTLQDIVNQNVRDIAGKASSSDLAAISAQVTENLNAIGILNNTTIPGLNTKIDNKANAADVYTKTEINAITGTVTSGKTIVKMIEDAQAAATYDDTAVKALITAEETRALAAEGALAGRLETVEDFFKAVETPDEVIDTLAEIVSYIENDKTGAANMLASIEKNANDIIAINDATTGILAQAKKHTDDSIAALPFATAEKAGLVKSSTDNNKIKVEEDGTMSINKIDATMLFIPDDSELILNGGGA